MHGFKSFMFKLILLSRIFSFPGNVSHTLEKSVHFTTAVWSILEIPIFYYSFTFNKFCL